MPQVLPASGVVMDAQVKVLIIGAGACGLTAALAAVDHTDDVLVLERDEAPSGSTALSSGFVPAAGTSFQKAKGIKDSAEVFARDITAKAHGTQDAELTRVVAGAVGPVLDWLARDHGLHWQVLDGFLYPGHSCHRMHTVPEKTGLGLMTRMQAAVAAAGVPVATGALVDQLYIEYARIRGVGLLRPDGARERIGCEALILACNGYGGHAGLIDRHLPEMRDALYFGHVGNQGDAVLWGQSLGAATRDLSGYQGHGSVAVPHGILITWALMMEGGIQVNRAGLRFSNEHQGYSEQSVSVLAQPDARAWNIYDARLHALGLEFPDYRTAVEAGAVKQADTADDLARILGVSSAGLHHTLEQVTRYQAGDQDPFGRDFTTKPVLAQPLFGIEVTGALFHTQGGLCVNENAQVLAADGSVFENLYAGGGAACGVSGPDVSGYLSGNGLLTAFALGALAGWHAAEQVK